MHLSMNTISTAASSKLADELRTASKAILKLPFFGNSEATKGVSYSSSPQEGLATSSSTNRFSMHWASDHFCGRQACRGKSHQACRQCHEACYVGVLGEVLAIARKRGLDSPELLAFLTAAMSAAVCKRFTAQSVSVNTTLGVRVSAGSQGHQASGLIHSDDSQIDRSSSSSRHESRNCGERHQSGSPSA
jgi:hypothetical protein